MPGEADARSRGLCKSYGGRAVVADLSLAVARRRDRRPARAERRRQVDDGGDAVRAGRRRPRRASSSAAASRARRSSVDAHDAKRRIGVVPQELSIYENLGAAANLALFGALYGLVGHAAARARRRGARAGRPRRPRATTSLQIFSGGMKRRLNIAAAPRPRPRHPDPRRADGRRRPAEQERDLRQPRDPARRAARRCSTRRTTWKRPSGCAIGSSSWTTGESSPATRSPACTSGCPRSRRSSSRSTARSTRRARARAGDRAAAAGRNAPARRRRRARPRRAGAAGVARRAWPRVHRISSGRAGLEDVFLSLTGRQLRD